MRFNRHIPVVFQAVAWVAALSYVVHRWITSLMSLRQTTFKSNRNKILVISSSGYHFAASKWIPDRFVLETLLPQRFTWVIAWRLTNLLPSCNLKFIGYNQRNFCLDKGNTMAKTACAMHILVDNEKLTNVLLVKLKRGISFDALARKYSGYLSKRHGGSFGKLIKGSGLCCL